MSGAEEEKYSYWQAVKQDVYSSMQCLDKESRKQATRFIRGKNIPELSSMIFDAILEDVNGDGHYFGSAEKAKHTLDTTSDAKDVKDILGNFSVFPWLPDDDYEFNDSYVRGTIMDWWWETMDDEIFAACGDKYNDYDGLLSYYGEYLAGEPAGDIKG